MLSRIGFGRMLLRIGLSLVCGLAEISAKADVATIETLYQFTGSADGFWSDCTPLSMSSDGTLYGAVYTGGDFQRPGMYRIDDSGVLTWMDRPERLVQPLTSGADGALYGFDYGSSQLFRISPAGEIAPITHNGYIFPQSRLVVDDLGFIYWASSQGEYGAIQRLSPNGEYSTMHGFNGHDGKMPQTVIAGHDGYLYGITAYGGTKTGKAEVGGGVVFRLSKTGEFKILHEFASREGGWELALLHANDGCLYGTRSSKGDWRSGYLFRIDLKSGKYTVLHDFRGGDGAWPSGPLTEGDDGYVYGTTSKGGPGGNGVVYRFNRSGKVQTVYAFSGLDGSAPVGGLVKRGNAFFGVTRHGGTSTPQSTQGTVFKLVVPRELSEAGPWDGLFRTVASEPRIVGNAVVSVTAQGAFSLAMRIGRDRVAFHGNLDAAGRYARQAVRGQQNTYAIELRKLWTGRVHGHISDGKVSATFDVVPGVPLSPFPNVSHIGVDLALLPKVGNRSGEFGYMRVVFAGKKGRVIAAGYTPDGMPFSTSSTLGLGRQIGFYIPQIGAKRRLLAGTVDFFALTEGAIPASRRCPGELIWTRSEDEQPRVKLAAFYFF